MSQRKYTGNMYVYVCVRYAHTRTHKIIYTALEKELLCTPSQETIVNRKCKLGIRYSISCVYILGSYWQGNSN